jgi:hypothetical protein
VSCAFFESLKASFNGLKYFTGFCGSPIFSNAFKNED